MYYKQGVIYIWQNQTGIFSYLNGSETTVICKVVGSDSIWTTDTPAPNHPHLRVAAHLGCLREKKPPSGELKVLEWFKQPLLEPA